jgi:SAM-dependent methyltransferase
MDQSDYASIFFSAVELKGRDVLEVGGSIPPKVAEYARSKTWTSINISDRYGFKKVFPDWYKTRIMSVCKMDFPDNTFDAVFSSDCFEHVDDVPKAFAEIYRVLKPGGIFFTIFGPVWSGPVGHHTWVYGKDGTPITFNDKPFPDWYHLTHSRDELGDLLRARYDVEDVESILRYVYDSKDVNRNPDSLYEREIARYKFVPILQYTIRGKQDPSPEIINLLRRRHPNVTDFRTSGFFWVLAKDRKNPFYFLRVWVGAAIALFLVKWRNLPIPKALKPSPGFGGF